MKKICMISDTHDQLNKIIFPHDCDMLLIAGDITGMGTIPQLSKFNLHLQKVIKAYGFKDVVYISGNHDFLLQKDGVLAQSLITGAHYLQDSMIEIDGIRIYGSPWSPFFHNWAWNLNRGPQIRAKWDLIPECDILITHGPCYGILDEADLYSGHLGCRDLLDAVLRIKPKIHLAGHIHGGYGVKEFEGITFVNSSSCNEMYKPVNPPIVIEIE